jgi:NAD+ synthase (glutamine-hydrolysing)
MKIGLAQLNYHIGNFPENVRSVESEINSARKKGADLLLFSELAICGYPPLDLLEQREFVEECYESVKKIARLCTDIGVLIGTPTINPNPTGKKLFNSACFLYQGKIVETFHKTLLPTYDIFDEYRHFQSNPDFRLLDFKGIKIAVTICEDLWFNQPVENEFASRKLYTVNPMEKLAALKPDLIINMAASPFSFTRIEAKKSIFINAARHYHMPCIYLNQVGGQTELIFEGGSLVINSDGQIVKELKYFSNDSFIIDTVSLKGDKLPPVKTIRKDPVEMIHDALILGIKDFFTKSGFTDAVLGLSGGIDSAVTVVIAARALGNNHVHVLLLPSEYTSEDSIKDAVRLAEKLGIRYNIISIQNIFNQYRQDLKPVFRDLPEDITEENIQSRIRSIFLMALSNKFRYILLNTSNKSEAAVGYGTLYGDMAGGLSVLGDVYKTDVYRLAGYINRNEEIIPQGTIIKPPTAELKRGQKDTDSLPEYSILDKILFEFIEHKKSANEIIYSGFDADLVMKVVSMINKNEFKRYQTPPILRVSSKAFGPGRRMPLVAKYP